MAVSFDKLALGEVFWSPVRTVTEQDAKQLIATGGFTHPIFTDAEYVAASPFGRTPLPGQAVLLLMGGLAEQTSRFDETTIALIGLDDTRFVAPVFPGDSIRVEITVSAKEPSEKRGLIIMRWRCVNQGDEEVVVTSARMLFRR